MLQRGIKSFRITFGHGLFVVSMENAAMVKSKSLDKILSNRKSQYNIKNQYNKEIKKCNIFQLLSTSMSYFTVLYSTRQDL